MYGALRLEHCFLKVDCRTLQRPRELAHKLQFCITQKKRIFYEPIVTVWLSKAQLAIIAAALFRDATAMKLGLINPASTDNAWKINFPSRISSVNVNKYWRNPWWKTSFFVQWEKKLDRKEYPILYAVSYRNRCIKKIKILLFSLYISWILFGGTSFRSGLPVKSHCTKNEIFHEGKVSKYGVFFSPFLPVFSPNTGKNGPE